MLLRVIAVRSQAPSLGPDSMSVIATEDQVAQLYWRQGRKEEAALAAGGPAISPPRVVFCAEQRWRNTMRGARMIALAAAARRCRCWSTSSRSARPSWGTRTR